MTAADASTALEAQLLAQMQEETHAMLRHALSNGLALPPRLLVALRADATAAGDADVARLASLHAELVRIVAPALPGTLRLLQKQVDLGGIASLLGPLENIRWLTVASMGFVLCFVLVGMSPLIKGNALMEVTYELEGMEQLVVMLFLLSAAGMGSAFQALFTALGYVSRATYDSVHDASYWIRIGLGLVAGLMLATLVPLGEVSSANGSASASAYGRPVLALLGGFSVQLVHRVLQRMVDTVQSLFDGDPADRQRQSQQLSQAAAQQDVSQARIELAAQLVQLRDLVAQGASPEQMHDALSRLTGSLLDPATSGGTKAAPDPRESHSG